MDPDFYRTAAGSLPSSLNRYTTDITSLLAEQSQAITPGIYASIIGYQFNSVCGAMPWMVRSLWIGLYIVLYSFGCTGTEGG